jgi:hypothetical protein
VGRQAAKENAPRQGELGSNRETGGAFVKDKAAYCRQFQPLKNQFVPLTPSLCHRADLLDE